MMIRRALPTILALLLPLLSACDTQDTLAIVPEFQESFGFETGLDGWTGQSGGLPAQTSVEVQRTTGSAADGEGWVRLSASAETSGGRMWIARAFPVTPEEVYEVTLEYRLGTSDGPATPAWNVVSAVTTEVPTAAALTVRGNTAPEVAVGSLVWEPRDHSSIVISGPADAGEPTATVWIALGLDIGTGEDRVYGFDSIEVTFLRN